MVRVVGWSLFGMAYAISLASAVLPRPIRRWTTPRELVVLGDPFAFRSELRVSFEGWTIERDASGNMVVRRGAHQDAIPFLDPVLVRSDEAGTFLDVDWNPRHPCGRSQVPRAELRALSFLLGLATLSGLAMIGVGAQRRLRMRRLIRPQSTATYRATGRPTGEDIDVWRAIERDARASCAALLGATLLVTTWVLVIVGVL